MIEAFRQNRKTTFWGTLIIVSEFLRANPGMVSFLPDSVEGYILGLSSAICTFMAFLSARDKESSEELITKAVNKAIKRESLKTEIQEETAVLVETAKELVEAKTPVIQILPVDNSQNITQL